MFCVGDAGGTESPPDALVSTAELRVREDRSDEDVDRGHIGSSRGAACALAVKRKQSRKVRESED